VEPGNWIALGAVAVGLVGNRVTWKLANRRFDHRRSSPTAMPSQRSSMRR